MSLQDDDQQVLDAIEDQLRTEDPQLIDCFSALGSIALPIKPVRGWERRKHRRTGRRAFLISTGLARYIIAVVLVALLTVGALWLAAALSH